MHVLQYLSRAQPVPSLDILNDGNTLYYLNHGEYPQDADDTEKKRINRRAQNYTCQEDKAHRRPAGKYDLRLLPPPEERLDTCCRTHEENGHFRTRRIASLVQLGYYWPGSHAMRPRPSRIAPPAKAWTVLSTPALSCSQ
ncbi:hypothetical protein N2152v2_010202 [Parachlorella kessleri]